MHEPFPPTLIMASTATVETSAAPTRAARAAEKENRQEKIDKKNQATPLYIAWLVGHGFVTIGGLYYILTCVTRQSRTRHADICYRFTFFSATVTYLFSIIQTLNGELPGFFALLPLDTFQYCVLALLWTITPAQVFKLLPYLLFSSLHFVEQMSYQFMDPNEAEKVADQLDLHAEGIGNSLGIVNLATLVMLVLEVLLFRSGAMFSLVIFGMFYRLRLFFSKNDQQVFFQTYKFINHHLDHERTPKKVREYWVRLRTKIENSSHYGDQVELRALERRELRATEDAIRMENYMG